MTNFSPIKKRSKQDSENNTVRIEFLPILCELNVPLLYIPLDAPSLTLKHSSAYGMHIHLSKARRDIERIEKSKVFRPLAESKSTKVYLNQVIIIDLEKMSTWLTEYVGMVCFRSFSLEH